MADDYKTPGVYVNEVSMFPSSVAQVETAIPAFIGYTEKASNLAPDDLLNIPKRIGSLVEYTQYFGAGPPYEVTEVTIDDNNNFKSAKVNNKFLLFDSLRLFYANGGGDCYIVSIGNYKVSSVSEENLKGGIDALENEDAPTILLFPDAANLLAAASLGNVQKHALGQCGRLQDRVAILDLKKEDAKGVNFRNEIGINALSYGMAYTPWLKVALPKSVKYSDIKSSINRSGINISLDGLTNDLNIKSQIASLEAAYADINLIEVKAKLLNPPDGNLSAGFHAAEAAFNASNTNEKLQEIFKYIYSIAGQIDKFIKKDSADTISLQDIKKGIVNAVKSNFVPLLVQVRALEKETAEKLKESGYTAIDLSTILTSLKWKKGIDAAASNLLTGATDNEKRISTLNILKPLFGKINQGYLKHVVNAANEYANVLDNALRLTFPVYKNILEGVATSMTSLPPCGAVAGIFAYVDGTRGVWKAPANVSLNMVIGPEYTFSSTELDNLNIDVNTGKSINAIRSFTGKGTLVWGARTLAGNDNEWRYLSVRRFFNMVEESVKKASSQFVFEPNDANTWIKVRAMIENYLTTLWRQGALAGAKPDHAFFVRVGLGETMTPLDIAEGRMIVEMGLAAVRPAEFILLRFSHKMQES